jgi:hypothetical protein
MIVLSIAVPNIMLNGLKMLLRDCKARRKSRQRTVAHRVHLLVRIRHVVVGIKLPRYIWRRSVSIRMNPSVGIYIYLGGRKVLNG